MNLQLWPQTQRKQTVPAKAFPTQMRGRKLEAPERPNTLNICTLIVFHCLGHSERSHSQAFKIPPSPSNRPFASIKKLIIHFIIWAVSLSQPVYSHSAWHGTHWEIFNVRSPEFRKKFCCISHWRLDSENFGLCKTNHTMSSQQHVCIYFWMENNCQMEVSMQIGWDWLNTQFHSHKTKAD